MPYDPTAPTVNTSLRVSNPVLLADKVFIKNGLEREHTFVADETAGATGEHLRHTEGSGRIWIYDNAIEATVPILAAAYSQAKAHAKGYVVIDIQKGRIWYCTDGALDLWIEGSKLGGNLALGGNLTVGGTLGVTGNTSLAGDLTLVTGKKLKVPPGESVILQSGAPSLTMDLFTHGARHRPGGTDGVWTANFDTIPFLPQRVLVPALLGPLNGANVLLSDTDAQVFGSAADAKQVIGFSTAGRPTATRMLCYCEATVRKVTGATDFDDAEIQMALYLDATGAGGRQGASAYRSFEANVGSGLGRQTMSFWRWMPALTAGAHILALHLGSTAAAAPVCESTTMVAIDFGIV